MKYQPLTPEKIAEFLYKLDGKDGCNFRLDRKGEPRWACDSKDMTRPISRKILEKMKIHPDIIQEFLEECEELGGYCDCEILFNAEEPLTEKYGLDKFTIFIDVKMDEEEDVYFAVAQNAKGKDGFPFVAGGKSAIQAVYNLKPLLPENMLLAVNEEGFCPECQEKIKLITKKK
jgi:hypothetical protein